MMAGWGLVSALSAAIFNVPGFIVTRFVLGIFQSGFLPSIVIYISYFYTREEWATRLSYVSRYYIY